MDQTNQKKMLYRVYSALQERGYAPVRQLVGYILSEDPTYITTHSDARKAVTQINRDALLQEVVEEYFWEQSSTAC